MNSELTEARSRIILDKYLDQFADPADKLRLIGFFSEIMDLFSKTTMEILEKNYEDIMDRIKKGGKRK